MKKYVKLAKLLMSASMQKVLAYKLNAFFATIAAAMYFISIYLSLHFVLDKTPVLAGLTTDEVLMYMFIAQVWWHVNVVFIRKNFQYIHKAINTGHIDWLLLKPVRLRTLLAFIHIEFRNVPSAMIMITALIWHINNQQISLVNILLGSFCFLIGMVISYKLHEIWAGTLFWLGRSDLFFVWMIEVPEFIKNPLVFFPTLLRVFLTILIPVFLITQPTAMALNGDLTLELVALQIGILIWLTIITNLVWNHGLKVYTSTN